VKLYDSKELDKKEYEKKEYDKEYDKKVYRYDEKKVLQEGV